VHQPYRLKKSYSFFDIGSNHFYEDDDENRAICNKVSTKCYVPTNRLMLKLINKHKGKFRISYSISGTALEQFERYNPEVLDLFKELAATGCVEFINETYFHSLSFLFSREEFRQQVLMHKNRIEELFNYTPVTFRNTELIYNNELASFIEGMGYQNILAEGADRILNWRSPNYLYQPANCYKLNLLMKNYKLSDDIAFRFSNRGWEEYPLTADKYSHWVHGLSGNGELINLFMDYETFGEHQWEDSGVFSFMEDLPAKIFRHKDYQFITPRQAAEHYTPIAKVDVPEFVSWADIERNLTAWLGNPLQDSAIDYAYRIEQKIKAVGDPALIHTWRKLLTSDHFYYMCTKWFADGDVHKYFNPYSSPYDAYLVYVNVLNDLEYSIRERTGSPQL
jgi:alpha-amylase